jgi:alkylated DNA repair dioxygenase AlkB
MAEPVTPWDYMERVVSEEESLRYYSVCKGLVRKEKADVKLYGKVFKEPRYKNFFSKDGHPYVYSRVSNPSAGWPKEIQELADIAQQTIGCDLEFDSALVNYYPDGEHYISPHNDKDAMNGYIASFSFGATRTFRIKGNGLTYNYDVKDGSLFVMKPGMQQEYSHEVPKAPKVTAGRINVTLRQQQHLQQASNKKQKVAKD